MSEENCGHISIAEYEAFDECRDCLRRWPKKDAPVSDDTDKAAREWADEWASLDQYHDRTHHRTAVDAFKAGASHALSRPLSEEEIEEAAIAVCWAGFHSPHPSKGGPHKYWERVTESNREYYRRLARGVAEVLQRMRTKG
jgi:hypothetical protein